VHACWWVRRGLPVGAGRHRRQRSCMGCPALCTYYPCRAERCCAVLCWRLSRLATAPSKLAHTASVLPLIHGIRDSLQVWSSTSRPIIHARSTRPLHCLTAHQVRARHHARHAGAHTHLAKEGGRVPKRSQPADDLRLRDVRQQLLLQCKGAKGPR